ncbi:MAG: SGNH/GDSL hydrolase family protein [Candidatus Alcyoniella australis]|nr:SGNH/GDSL hydrolase family protein [Candidatus Alcyoniella australis]
MEPTAQQRLASTTLTSCGLLLLVAALLYNPWLLRAVLPSGVIVPQLTQLVPSIIGLALSGLSLLLIARLIGRLRIGAWLFERKRSLDLLLFVAALLVPLMVSELYLRPFAQFARKTTIFLPDHELGWKLRPGAVDTWARVDVRINAKGLRGPELEYAKPVGVKRILYLGDSLTFGYGIRSYGYTFAYQVQRLLAQSPDCRVQTINAGVDGYSPWQELIYLQREGLKYDPDLVVLGFVLNDVVEKYVLTRYGGTGVGFQLMQSYVSLTDRLCNISGLMYFARRLSARIRLGEDVQRGAQQQQLLQIRDLIRNPNDPLVKKAWAETLANVDGIVRLCKEREIALLIVVFPFTIQFQDMQQMNEPQLRMIEYAGERGVPVIDMLPLLAQRAEQSGLTIDQLFLDGCHPSHAGHRIVAEIIAQRLMDQGLPAGCPRR